MLYAKVQTCQYGPTFHCLGLRNLKCPGPLGLIKVQAQTSPVLSGSDMFHEPIQIHVQLGLVYACDRAEVYIELRAFIYFLPAHFIYKIGQTDENYFSSMMGPNQVNGLESKD